MINLVGMLQWFTERVRVLLPGRLLLTMTLVVGLFSSMPQRTAYAASFVVTNLNASGSGSLREAITLANAAVGHDTITFNINGTIQLSATLPAINDDLGIDATGHAITVSGKSLYRVVTVNSGKMLSLWSLTITRGSDAEGAGIYNSGRLNIMNSTFYSNTADLFGGGIYSTGTLSITNSTFNGNKSSFPGGAIWNSGALTITNSTFSGNGDVAGVDGGSIYNQNAPLTMLNNIIGDSTAGGDCGNSGGTVTGSYNLIEDASRACGLIDGVNGNIIGVDPLLGPLVNNGGSTLTMMPLPGSQAIDAGANAGCPATDQRGISRPQGSVCDIGAIETVIWLFQYLPMVLR